MKKILLITLLFLLGGGAHVFAATTGSIDTQLEDAIKNQTDEQVKQTAQTLTQQVKFDKFNSCSDMEKVLNDFAKNYSGQRYAGGGMLLNATEDSLPSSSVGSIATDVKSATTTAQASSSTDFSQTNIQVKGVDEPDIIKTDGNYIYYYNQAEKQVFILKSPLDISSSTINLSNAKVIKSIKIPENFSNINLFVYKNKLVILSNRYAQLNYTARLIDTSSRTSVVIYDTTDINNLKLLKFFDVNGSFVDARLIDDNIYLVSQMYINLYNYRRPIALNSDVKSSLDNFSAIKSSEVLPKSVEITYTTDTSKQNFTGGYNSKISSVDCTTDIMYLLPSKETIQKYNISPTMAVVSKINLSNINKAVEKKVLFGDVSQIHMTKDSLYLADNFWVGYNFTCPMGAYCIMPYFRGTENTLLHKFDLTSGATLNYNNTTIIPGSPLNQYSMSEDDNGNFRILTNTWWPDLNTSLYVLSKDLKMIGSYTNIKQDEQFKASRFIGNMLYLVTFKQVDPLFVFDISTPSKPTLVGELKIPGYSTYLHPYAEMSGGIQYLVGLGYDTGTGSWGGTVNSGVKVDLYKVNFNLKDSNNMISIQQEYSKTLGGEGSYTEALDNPRMFVWNEAKKLLILPLFISNQFKTKTCTTGVPGYESCYDSSIQVPSFAGIKGITVDAGNGISESFSKDYMSILSGNRQYAGNYPYSQWEFTSLMNRVGYAGDSVYLINNLFGSFFYPNQVDQGVMTYLNTNSK